jgi:4-hydroxythreonine-4-phosphate dehydrogenase
MVKVGITHGDINGIGYEIILKTFLDIRIAELCIPVIYGSTKVAAYHRKALNLQPIMFNQIAHAGDAEVNKVNIINCSQEEIKVELGKATRVAGDAALLSLDRATKDLDKGLIDVLVTAPINKDSIQQEGFQFPGHTEYLESKFSANGEKSLMILANDSLRVALVTGHIPLSDVPKTITKEKIQAAIAQFNWTLRRDFNIGKPRIAVLSINPHAGENGLLGKEEQALIVPALQEESSKGALCFGPFAADGFFGSGQFKNYDGVLAMYHDQGLTPFKTLAMENGVNFTAGLSVIRTSPAHGTAYDLAGKNEASEESFRQAIYLAIDSFRNRKTFDKAHANPLKKLYYEKGADNEVIDLTKDE